MNEISREYWRWNVTEEEHDLNDQDKHYKFGSHGVWATYPGQLGNVFIFLSSEHSEQILQRSTTIWLVYIASLKYRKLNQSWHHHCNFDALSTTLITGNRSIIIIYNLNFVQYCSVTGRHIYIICQTTLSFICLTYITYKSGQQNSLYYAIRVRNEWSLKLVRDILLSIWALRVNSYRYQQR